MFKTIHAWSIVIVLFISSSTAVHAVLVADDFEDGEIASGWTLAGVGNANQQSAVESAGTLALTADGATAFYGADNAGFLYREVDGDFRVEVTLDGTTMTTGGLYRKAGLMVRASLDKWDQRLLALLAPYWANGDETHLQFVAREAFGEPGRLPVARDVEGVPRVVRLAVDRVGETLGVEYSLDQGDTWIRPSTGLGGTIDIPDLPQTLLVGLAMVSNDISVTSTAHFDDFVLALTGPCQSPAPVELTPVVEDDPHEFGLSTAIDDGVAIAGTPFAFGEPGLVQVFEQDASGAWTYRQDLVPTPAEDEIFFGYSLAARSGTALVGAREDDSLGMNAGAAFVFTRDASGTWSQSQRLTASDAEPLDFFSESVALSDDVMLISSEADGGGGDRSGVVYLFEKDSSGLWVEQQRLVASDGEATELFGAGLAVSGETAFIGAATNDEGVNSGSVYIFRREASGQWVERQKLKPAEPVAEAFFGSELAADGETVLIGAPNESEVHVADFDGLEWSISQVLTVADGQLGESFGFAVGLSGDLALIGAPVTSSPLLGAGGVYLFRREGGTWIERDRILRPDPDELSFFGASLDLGGGQALIGAPGHDGAAWVYSVCSP